MGMANRKTLTPNESVRHVEVSLAGLTDDGEVIFGNVEADIREIIDFTYTVKTAGVGAQNVQLALRPTAGANVTELTAAFSNTAAAGTTGSAVGTSLPITLTQGIRLALRAEFAAAVTSGPVVYLSIRYRR